MWGRNMFSLRNDMKNICELSSVQCKKIRRFYGKIPGKQLPVHIPLFLRASACRTFKKSRNGRVMLTDNTQKYLCRV